MKILVTGATSGLGRNAIDYLIENNLPVKATGRNQKQGDLIAKLGVEFFPADLANLTAHEAELLFNNVDTIWHCAALSSPWGKYDDFYNANVVATKNLILYAKKYHVKKFIHISTPSIYFDFQDHLNIKEDYRAKKFVNNYAKTKILAEEEIVNAAKNQPKTCFIIIRPRAIFGDHDRVLLPRLIELIKKKKGNIALPKAGNALLDLTYAKNVIEAMNCATNLSDEKQKQLSGNAYNISNQEPIQLKVILEKLAQGLGYNLSIKSIPYGLIEAITCGLELISFFTKKEPILTRYGIAAINYNMTLDCSKANHDLGYQPQYNMEQSIQNTINWIKKQKDL